MHLARIADLLHPFLTAPDPDDQRPTTNDKFYRDISTYIDLLLRWNARISLTAIRDPEEIVTRHFGESLFAARHLFPLYPASSSVPPVPSVIKDFDVDSANDQRLPLARPEPSEGTNDPIRVADLGSGAGFPGIPTKLWAPNIALTLIESHQKKATFLREVIRSLTLTNIDIQNTRAETLPPKTFDLVTLRAVERFANILPTAAALLSPSGRLALLISSSQLDTVHSALPHLAWQPAIPIPNSESRHFLVGHVEPRE